MGYTACTCPFWYLDSALYLVCRLGPALARLHWLDTSGYTLVAFWTWTCGVNICIFSYFWTHRFCVSGGARGLLRAFLYLDFWSGSFSVPCHLYRVLHRRDSLAALRLAGTHPCVVGLVGRRLHADTERGIRSLFLSLYFRYCVFKCLYLHLLASYFCFFFPVRASILYSVLLVIFPICLFGFPSFPLILSLAYRCRMIY